MRTIDLPYTANDEQKQRRRHQLLRTGTPAENVEEDEEQFSKLNLISKNTASFI